MTTLQQHLHDAIEQEDEAEEGGETASRTVKLSLRGAINDACKDCIYDDQDKGAGNWRQQVEACTVTKCPLYPVRPISKPKKVTELPSQDE